MTGKKKTIKASPRKLQLVAKKIGPKTAVSKVYEDLDDKTFRQHLDKLMKEKESLMRKLSKR